MATYDPAAVSAAMSIHVAVRCLVMFFSFSPALNRHLSIDDCAEHLATVAVVARPASGAADSQTPRGARAVTGSPGWGEPPRRSDLDAVDVDLVDGHGSNPAG